MQQSNEQLLAVLAKLGGQTVQEDDIRYEGSSFVIPASMDIDDAIRYLSTKQMAGREKVSLHREYRYLPNDGAVCATRALKRSFGMTIQVPTQTLLGSEPGESRSVVVDANGKTELVPWGSMVLPMLGETVVTFGSWFDEDDNELFRLTIYGPRYMEAVYRGLMIVVGEELENASIYRGHAINGKAEYMDVSNVDTGKLTYSSEVMTQLDANVWAMIQHRDAMKSAGIGMKRTVLLEGPYGSGKTMAAFRTAQLAVSNGWTFIYCRPGKDDLETVLRMATLYMPAVVFFEDIDTASDPTDSNADSVSRLLDMFDGITNKGTELLAIMTTNHADRIHKGMVRPGRLDAIVHIAELDYAGLAKMVRNVIPTELFAVDDMDAVYDAMNGYMPAFVREALDRAIRYSIARGNGTADAITTADVVNAAEGLRAQHDLMESAAEHGPADPLSVAMARVITDAIAPAVENVGQNIDSTRDSLSVDISNATDEGDYRMRRNIRETYIVDDEGEPTGEKLER